MLSGASYTTALVPGGTITSYKKLDNYEEMREAWTTGFEKEFRNLAQLDNTTGTPGMDAIHVMDFDQMRNIPIDRVVTYARIDVDFRPQKKDPNRVRITAGGHLIACPDELTTRTADLTCSKILWNSVLGTGDAKHAVPDIANFYLGTPLDRYEYMKMPIDFPPPHIKQQYDLESKVYKRYVWLETRKTIYGLPQAGILANKQQREKLEPHGYYKVPHTPGLWQHVTRPVQFSLVVDDFGVKYV